MSRNSTHRRRLFAPASRYPSDPRAVFVLALCILAAIPLVIGKTRSDSLDHFIPQWGVIAWGAFLLFGAVISLLGMARQTPNGISLEQVGSVVVGVGTVYYAVVAILYSGTFPPAVAITLAWGLSCFWRWGQLQALVRSTIATLQQQEE